MSKDKLETVRLLLAKAEGAATMEEAEAYNLKAAELMARHGIDSALLAASGELRDDVEQQRITVNNPYGREKAQLLCLIAHALRCRSVMHTYGPKVTGCTVVGHTSDLERVELLYTSLLLQAATQVTSVRPDRLLENVAAYRRSWLVGFAIAVGVRLTEAEAAATTEARPDRHTAPGGLSTELVLADRDRVVNRAFNDAFPDLKSTRGRVLSGSGMGDGRAAGARADLGGGRKVSRGARGALHA